MQKDIDAAERRAEALRAHTEAIEELKKEASAGTPPGSSQALRRHDNAIETLKKDASAGAAPGSSQDHLKMRPPTPKIKSIEEARQILMDLGMTRAVRQQYEELAEVNDSMVTAARNGWYEPGVIWKHAESEKRKELNEEEEAKIRHYEVEREYMTEKHIVVKALINSEILEMTNRELKERDEGTLDDNPMHSKLTKKEARRTLCSPEDLERIKDIDRTQEEARKDYEDQRNNAWKEIKRTRKHALEDRR